MNELWIYDAIGEGLFESGVTDKSVRDELKGFKKSSPLNVRINSPGGSVFHAVAIKTMLDQWKGPVDVQVDGLAASAAGYIAMAGDTISMAEGSMFMMHNPQSMAVGNATDMRTEADLLDKVGGSLIKAYVDRTGLDESDITEMMEAETWLTAEEAVTMGFAHSLIQEHQAAAFAIPEAMGFRNVPEHAPVVAADCRPKGNLASLQRRMELCLAR